MRFDVTKAYEKKKGKSKKKPRFSTVNVNKSIEAEYYKEMRGMLEQIKTRFNNVVMGGIDTKKTRGQFEDESLNAKLQRLLDFVRNKINKQYDTERINGIAEKYANQTAKLNGIRFNNNVERGLSIDLKDVPDFQNMKPYMKNVIRKNANLIRSLKEENLSKLETILLGGMEKGWTTKRIAEEINKSYNVSRKRSVLIARNEINTLNGELTKKRMENLGLNLYKWQTSEDERVRGNPRGRYPKARPSHYVMNDKICRYDDHTVYSDDGKKWKKRTSDMPEGIPREAVGCRCDAIVWIE